MYTLIAGTLLKFHALDHTAGFSSISHIGGSSKKLESLFLSMTLHMNYLLSLEDSERTRSACIRYIQNWLHEFYPYRPDLGEKLIQIASRFGAGVIGPRLSWKYYWIARLFGWGLARRAQALGPRLRQCASIAWDKTLYNLENGSTLTRR